MKMNYTISVLHMAPRMTCDFVDFVGTYKEAVQYAQDLWRTARRSVCVRSGGDRAGYWWHRIDHSGACTDRNTNSGVPQTSSGVPQTSKI